MADDLFHAAQVKLRRARKHILSVNDEMEIQAREHAKFLAAWSMINDDIIPETPINPNRLDEVACCVGDAIHNLRSALDLLACEVVEKSGESPKDVHFPFADTEKALTEKTATSDNGGMVKRHKFHRAREDARKAHLGLRPHGEPHGNALLWGLHRLDLIDKHQDLLTLTSEVWGGGLYRDGTKLTPRNDGGMILVFAPAGLFAGQAVPTVLNSLAGEVERTIQTFSNLGW